MSGRRRTVIGVMGAGACDEATSEIAREVGRRIAEAGAVLLCGGRTGVMEAAARGAHEAGGLVVGVMPGRSADESPPNEWIDVAVFTGMGDGRNYVNVCSSDAIVAIAGGWGTLSEIALARKIGRHVVLIGNGQFAGALPEMLPHARDAEEAVALAIAGAAMGPGPRA
jgi:uncharacterized protein (TIGR00725 family)